ncbi:MAG: hypothetical protein IJB85_06945 [Clostridia bacterium]|nr:hypothetical protein [Clostridia bacterium]
MLYSKERFFRVYPIVVMRPALTLFEASVLPAKERRAYGALSMIPRAYDVGNVNQRAKIWVR